MTKLNQKARLYEQGQKEFLRSWNIEYWCAVAGGNLKLANNILRIIQRLSE